MNKKPKDIDEYISQFPDEIQNILQKLRKIIREAAPEAEETISYQMPAFRLKKVLVYFAACKEHIGFYPTNSGVEAFKSELKAYKTTKGSIHLPMDKELPKELISKIVKFRIESSK